MIAASLNDLAAQHLGDELGDYRAPCPLCAKKANDGAVNVTVKPDGSVVAHCHRCGENGTARPERINGKRPAARVRPSRPPEDHVALWEAGVEPGETIKHPYLTRKQVGAHGIRVKDDLLLVPVRNVAGELVGVEKIAPDKRFMGGTKDKLYVRGSHKVGNYHLIGTPDRCIVIAEGYATGATIFEATGIATAVAFDAGNLEAVAKALRAKHPKLDIIIAADDDIGTAGNPGKTNARAAALAIGARLAVPQWPENVDRGDGTDFNDLRNAADSEAVRRCIDQAKSIEPDDELAYQFADELIDGGDEADELVEHLLTRGAMSVVYGDSNSGKTFAAIDIGCAIARGITWMGRNVEPGMVIYLATESPASVRRRLRAYQKHHGCKVPNFAIVRSPVDLYNGADDTERVIALVRRLEQRRGIKCEIIIGDTLSRLSAGADENSSDMSIVVRHVDRIRRDCAAHFLLIHHTGKDLARGMRGWSGVRAATDTEIEITAADDTGTHAAEITKQRDIAGKGDRIGFRLQVVELGIGKWAKPITSCVIVSADAPAKQAPAKRPSEIAGAIVEFLTTRGAGIKKRELVDHLEARYTASTIYREIKKLIEARKLREAVGIVSLVNA